MLNAIMNQMAQEQYVMMMYHRNKLAHSRRQRANKTFKCAIWKWSFDDAGDIKRRGYP